MKYTTLLKNKPLLFIDKLLRLFGYYITVTGVDLKTKDFDSMEIRRN